MNARRMSVTVHARFICLGYVSNFMPTQMRAATAGNGAGGERIQAEARFQHEQKRPDMLQFLSRSGPGMCLQSMQEALLLKLDRLRLSLSSGRCDAGGRRARQAGTMEQTQERKSENQCCRQMVGPCASEALAAPCCRQMLLLRFMLPLPAWVKFTRRVQQMKKTACDCERPAPRISVPSCAGCAMVR